MELIIEAKPFAAALAQLSKVIPRRPSMTMLDCVWIEASRGAVTLTCSDLDIYVSKELPCIVEATGVLCVDARALLNFAKGSEGEIRLTSTDNSLELRSGRIFNKMPMREADDFPSPDWDFGTVLSIDGAQFISDLSTVSHAMSTEVTRYYLNGVHIQGGEALRLAATDGNRLAVVRREAVAFGECILPRKTVGLLCSLFAKAPLEELALSESKGLFSGAGWTVKTNMVDGPFPAVERVIPTHDLNEMHFGPSLLSACVKRVSSVASKKTRAVEFVLSRGHLAVSCTSAENGMSREEVLVNYEGEGLECGFNANYLGELFAAFIGSGAVTMHMSDSGAPARFTAPGAPHLTYVLMPMRV